MVNIYANGPIYLTGIIWCLARTSMGVKRHSNAMLLFVGNICPDASGECRRHLTLFLLFIRRLTRHWLVHEEAQIDHRLAN